MKLKTKLINQMLSALVNLNGRNRVIETEGKPSSSVFQSFAFPQQTRVNIIRNIAVLRPLNEAYAELQQALVKRLSPNGTAVAIDDDPELLEKYKAEHKELLKTMRIKLD